MRYRADRSARGALSRDRVNSRTALLGLGVGLALADSSIVTLALPEILGQFDVAITSVAWVLTSFNLVLAVVAVPAAYVARRRPREAFAVGAVVFAGASLACGLAPSFDVLVEARCVQAIGAALVVTAALDLLSQVEGSDERALRIWVARPVSSAPRSARPSAASSRSSSAGSRSSSSRCRSRSCCSSLRGASRRRRSPTPAGRPSILGERRPAPRRRRARGGALPRRAAARRRLGHVARGRRARRHGDAADRDRSRSRSRPQSLGAVQGVACGVILLRGRPRRARAHAARGLGVDRSARRSSSAPGSGSRFAAHRARASRSTDQVVHGGWTIAARHAGVVLGLLLLAPVLTTALDENRDEAIRAGAAVVLDSAIPPLDKLRVAQDVLAEVDRANEVGELPDAARARSGRPDDDAWSAPRRATGAARSRRDERVPRAVPATRRPR